MVSESGFDYWPKFSINKQKPPMSGLGWAGAERCVCIPLADRSYIGEDLAAWRSAW